MAEPTLYLFDGNNLLHAGEFADRRELGNALSSFVALRGARGVLVFDGHGRDERRGPLQIRFAPDADALLERLAAEHRHDERVCLVSSDSTVRETVGLMVSKIASGTFLGTLEPTEHTEAGRSEVGDRLDPETRARLDELRRKR